jgi:hypothetical protein
MGIWYNKLVADFPLDCLTPPCPFVIQITLSEKLSLVTRQQQHPTGHRNRESIQGC